MGRRVGIGTVCTILLFAGRIAHAASFVVAPTTLTLSSEKDTGILYITNHGTRPVTTEIEGFDWSQAGGKDVLTAATDLMVSPPMSEVAPGETQIVRLQAAEAGGGAGERSFRVLVSEIPDLGAPPARGVRILLQFSVPVFIRRGAAPAALSWDAALEGRNLVLTAHNGGESHAKLDRIALIGNGAPPRPADTDFAYLLAGADHRWIFPAGGLAPGAAIRVRAHDAANETTAEADIAVHR